VDIERETTMTQEDIDLFLESVDIGYTRCKVQPMTGMWLYYENNQVHGCGITAALISKNGIEGLEDADELLLLPETVEKEFNLSMAFVTGFLGGFDASKFMPELTTKLTVKPSVRNTEYTKGYQCGKEKREKWIANVSNKEEQ
jgi:hypothetical protein